MIEQETELPNGNKVILERVKKGADSYFVYVTDKDGKVIGDKREFSTDPATAKLIQQAVREIIEENS